MLILWDMAPMKTSQVIQNANYNILVDVLKIVWLLLKIQIYHKQLWRHRKKIQVKCSSRHLWI